MIRIELLPVTIRLTKLKLFLQPPLDMSTLLTLSPKIVSRRATVNLIYFPKKTKVAPPLLT